MADGIFLHNTIHVETDSFGPYSEESVVTGFENYGKGGKGYYSFDEVEELLKNGFVDNNIDRDKDGKLYLKGSYCSYCSAFSVVCGQVLTDITDGNRAMYEYCKKIGIVSDNFVPVKGWFGVKTMSRNEDDTFNIYYTMADLDTSKWNLDYIEKICVGAVKQLAGQRNRCHTGDGLEVTPKFVCKDVKFNKANRQLIIEGVTKKHALGAIVDVIRALDLELWMLCNEKKYWSRFFTAALDMVRDHGQEHWFSDLGKEHSFDKNKNRNKDWYDRKLGEEWADE